MFDVLTPFQKNLYLLTSVINLFKKYYKFCNTVEFIQFKIVLLKLVQVKCYMKIKIYSHMGKFQVFKLGLFTQTKGLSITFQLVNFPGLF